MAEGRYLSDELTIHYGLVPRTNRGIFAINELPDLAERIQVGLLNVLEERDVQVRGYKLRLPLDLVLVASPTPRTTPTGAASSRRSRTGSAARSAPTTRSTSRPRSPSPGRRRPFDIEGVRVTVPDYMTEIVATLSHLARESAHINQRSGVSVRLTVANSEVMVANAIRRALRHGERDVSPRVSDLDALAASTMGKVEIEALDDGRDEQIAEHLLRAATLTVFKNEVDPGQAARDRHGVRRGAVVHTGEDVTSSDLARLVEDLPALRPTVAALSGGDESPAAVASAVELVLEGLHLTKRLNKDAIDGARPTALAGRPRPARPPGPCAAAGASGAASPPARPPPTG